MSDIDYKEKYLDLRDKFLKSTDVAWRLGYEQGLKDSQIQQAQQQQQQMQMQQAQMQQMAQQQGQQDPNIGQDGQSPDIGQNPNMDQEGQVDPNADHLGQSMDELGQAVQKSETVSRSHLADFNLDHNAKKSHNLQKKIVDDIMKKWEQETPNTIEEILKATRNV
jgi:hypothetical protein